MYFDSAGFSDDLRVPDLETSSSESSSTSSNVSFEFPPKVCEANGLSERPPSYEGISVCINSLSTLIVSFNYPNERFPIEDVVMLVSC
jgi:hypothetical protein